MPTAQINDHTMYYELHGEGEPAIVMGGWGTFCHGGEAAAPRGILRTYQTLLFDYRGIGESTDDLSLTPSTTLYAEDLAELCDHLGWSSVHVIGMVGMGACVGQELALARPDLVRSLVMTGTWAKPDPIFIDQIEGFRRAHLHAGFATFQLLVASFSFDPDFYNANRDRLIGPNGAWAGLQGREQAHSRLIDACLGHDTVDRLGDIRCPTLVFHAGSDPVTRPEMTRVLEKGIPDARGIEWPEMAHVIAGKEQKMRFDEYLLNFLAEC